MSDSDSEVGYGKPPTSTRFRPGQSGNPGGRKKRVDNVATALAAELDATISVRENGREQRVKKSLAMAKALVARALKGDARAFAHIMQLLPDQFRLPQEAKVVPLTDTERQALERFVERQLVERRKAGDDRGGAA
jgi:gamma-glutamyl:cysteine ligase YbdK (ATP-grasp superfamily)